MVIGYRNVTRGPGFLGSKAGYLYLTNTEQGPAGLTRPESVSSDRFSRREKLLTTLLASAPETDDPRLLDYDDTIQQSLKLSGPDFIRSFQPAEDAADLRVL